MIRFRLLPWEYGVRNLFRRPFRSLLTLLALTMVVLLVFVVVGFIRGLDNSLVVSGEPGVVIVHSLGSSETLEISSVPMRTADVVSASLQGIERQHGMTFASPELYLGTQVATSAGSPPALGLVRGVTPAVLPVRRQVQITEGSWPRPGEVMVGRLAATKLGRTTDELAVGQSLVFEGRSWRISGRFASMGSALESELWCRLDELQQSLKREDLTLVAIKLGPEGSYGEVDEFCKERLDLELQATLETDYYAFLQRHYKPVRMLAWLVVWLLAGAGVFAGLNTMYGAVVGRVRELSTLQTIGFVRRALVLSLIQEATLLAVTGSLLAAFLALVLVNGMAVRFTMGAFVLRIDSVALLIGCCTGLLLGLIGAIPPALRAMRLPIAEGLKAV